MSLNSKALKRKTTVNKYKNKKTEYNGVKYDSKKEANHSAMLDQLRKAKLTQMRVVDVKLQWPLPIRIDGKLICTYKADFVVKYADGRIEYHDVKGFPTPVYKLKKKLVEAWYGIRILEK